MVDAYKVEFASLAKIYVANNHYPSIHVYTVDEALIGWIRYHLGARVIEHKGTNDVVITKRVDLGRAAAIMAAYCDPRVRPAALTLLKYCRMDNVDSRKREVDRLRRQLKVLKG